MNIEFNNVEELMQRVMPALKIRKRELRKIGSTLDEKEIWNYLINHYWKDSYNLSLSTIVNDILNRDIINVTKQDIQIRDDLNE